MKFATKMYNACIASAQSIVFWTKIILIAKAAKCIREYIDSPEYTVLCLIGWFVVSVNFVCPVADHLYDELGKMIIL